MSEWLRLAETLGIPEDVARWMVEHDEWVISGGRVVVLEGAEVAAKDE